LSSALQNLTRHITLFLLILKFGSYFLHGQELVSNLRNKQIEVTSDTIKLDTLSIVPESIEVYNADGTKMGDSGYTADYAHSLIIFNKDLKQKQLRLKYRVFTIDFSTSYGHKDTSLIIKNYDPNKSRPVYIITKKENDTFAGELDKNGSISRGFTFGNQRDLGTLSNLNLQLSGKLNEEVSILAAISDNNLPIQPEGNTQKIQEFDKVYIQLYTQKSGVKLGDIELDRPQGYFLNLKKQTRGLNLYSDFNFGKKKKTVLKSELTAGLAKGKYNKLKINGIEGNQGPYRLFGSDNETYIIILSGSEKVYINGKLLTRGEKFDYVIDYNSAELTFTANQPITKDSRITIEYEYAQQYYPRMQFMQTNHLKSSKSDFWLNFYLEQDNKNDPLSENYTDETKSLLASIGDSTHLAVAPNIRQVEYANDRVLYALKDSLHNGIVYDSIYVYSTNPDEAIYQLSFSYVGENQGNYQQITSNANGKVFEWVAPENGIPQGAYEPVSLFVTPQKHLMANLGGRFNTNAFGRAGFELSVSNLDVNTFSVKDGGDDIGYAFKFDIEQGVLNADTNKMQFRVFANYEMIENRFKPIENFKEVEFERDWNLPSKIESWGERNIGAGFIFSRLNLGFIRAQGNYMIREDNYIGKKSILSSNLRFKNFQLSSDVSYLQSNNGLYATDYLKHKFEFSKHFKYFTIGVSEETEDNKWQLNDLDSLSANSFKFSEYAVFASEPDSSINKYFASYKYREDYLPINNLMQKTSTAKTVQAGVSMLKYKILTWKTIATYRDIEYVDSVDLGNKHEDFLSGRQEISLRLAKGSINLSAFYETGSGLEIKKQYQYIEVQKGQGQFTWIDYNQNNVKELDEFELAKFADEADHIRIYVPSDEYVRAYSSQISSSIFLNPSVVWMKKTGFLGFLSMFSNQFAYRISQKTENPDYFPDLSDQEDLISRLLTIRNNFSLKSKNRRWQADYLYENSNNKSLLISGIDKRNTENNSLLLKWKLAKLLTLFNTSRVGNQSFNSEYFSWKNYRLKVQSNEFSIQIQPSQAFYTTLSYKLTSKVNELGVETVLLNEAKLIANQTINTKIFIQADCSFVQTNYDGETNSSAAYEMLDGLQNGKNIIWNVSYNQKLSKIFHLSVGYNGRTALEGPVIHNGSLQLRANF
jgi:hypothetical protein